MRESILLKGVSKKFGKVAALDGVDLKLKKGMSIILGANGAGKSTLLRCIDGLYKVDSGTVRVGGIDPYTDDKIHMKLALLSDNYALYDYLSVRDNLKFFGRLYGLKDSEILERASSVLKELDAYNYLDSKVFTLSRGTKQKVAFCRATINDPSIILLDEPTAFLDANASERIRKYLLRRERDGATVLFVTQKIDEVTRFNSEIFVIKKGRIVANTDSASLYKSMLKDSYINVRLARQISSSKLSRITGIESTNGSRATYIKVRISSSKDINLVIRELLDAGAEIAGIDYTEPLIEKLSLEGER